MEVRRVAVAGAFFAVGEAELLNKAGRPPVVYVSTMGRASRRPGSELTPPADPGTRPGRGPRAGAALPFRVSDEKGAVAPIAQSRTARSSTRMSVSSPSSSDVRIVRPRFGGLVALAACVAACVAASAAGATSVPGWVKPTTERTAKRWFGITPVRLDAIDLGNRVAIVATFSDLVRCRPCGPRIRAESEVAFSVSASTEPPARRGVPRPSRSGGARHVPPATRARHTSPSRTGAIGKL